MLLTELAIFYLWCLTFALMITPTAPKRVKKIAKIVNLLIYMVILAGALFYWFFGQI